MLNITIAHAPCANGSDFNAYRFIDINKERFYKIYAKDIRLKTGPNLYTTVYSNNEADLTEKFREYLLAQGVNTGDFEITIVTQS